MEAFIKQEHIFYKLENGKVTAINTIRKTIKISVCVPSIYANKLEVITKTDFENAKKETGL
jgi:hypothetical protein